MNERIIFAVVLIVVFSAGIFCGIYITDDSVDKDRFNSCRDNYKMCMDELNKSMMLTEECIELQQQLVLTTWRLCKENTCDTENKKEDE